MKWTLIQIASLLTIANAASTRGPPCAAPRKKATNAMDIDFRLQDMAMDLSCQKWMMDRSFRPQSRHVRTKQQKKAVDSAQKSLDGEVSVTFDVYKPPGEDSKSSRYADDADEVQTAIAPLKCRFSTGEEGTWTIKNRGLPERVRLSGPSGRALDEYAYERFMEIGPVLEIEVVDNDAAPKKNGKVVGPAPVLVYSIPLRYVFHVSITVSYVVIDFKSNFPTLYFFLRRVEFQKSRIRSASKGIIRWKPSRKAKTSSIFGFAGFHTPSGPNMVDPRWVKGKRWYWSKKDGFRSP